MVGRYRRLAALILLTVSSAMMTGCADFITEEARQSFASFLTGVFATAVEGTISP